MSSNIFIGKVYEKTRNNKNIKIGYRIFYYVKQRNLYRIYCGIDFDYNDFYSTDPECKKYGPRYIKADSLIPYESFGKKSANYEMIKSVCYNYINQLESEEAYHYNYTEEEIEEIHKKGELTINEKVEEMIINASCFFDDESNSATLKCHKYQNCKECLYTTLSKTGKRSFEPLKLQKNHSLILGLRFKTKEQIDSGKRYI